MKKFSPPVLRQMVLASLLAPSVVLLTPSAWAQPQAPINPFTGQPMQVATPAPAAAPSAAAPAPAQEAAPSTSLSTLLGVGKPRPVPAPAPVSAPAPSPTPTPTPAVSNPVLVPGSSSATAAAPSPLGAALRASSAPSAAGAAGAAGATAPSVAVPAAAPAAPSFAGAELSNTPNPGVTLKFDNADIYDVLQVVLGDILKLDYIIDPSLQGRITLKSTGAISMADIFSALETALATSNIAIVRQGKTYKVLRDAAAVRDSVAKQGVGPASLVMQIIPLQFVQANQLVNTLRNFVGPQAAITNDPANKHLIVTDRQANVDKIIEMVKTLDVDYFNHIQVKLLPLSHAEAPEMAKELEGLFKTSGLFNWAGTDAAKVYVLPVVRMNALLVATANDKLMQAAEQWVKTLDAEPRNGLGAYVHVYPVVNSNAPHLANILQQLFGGAAAPSNNTGASGLPSANSSAFGSASAGGAGAGGLGAASGGAANAAGTTRTIERGGNVPSAAGSSGSGTGLGGSVQVIADEGSNSLIIRASAQDYQQIRKVLERLDSSPRQVLIQVMVAEVTLTDTLQYGVEWWLKSALSHNGKSWPGFVGLEGALAPRATSASGATPAVLGNSSGLNYAVFGSAGQVIGMLNLLGQDTDVNILSTPHVLASDGKIAKVEVGNEIPVITQTVSTPSSGTLLGGSSFSTSNSVQYRPTGILLEVKPNITSSGNVSLSIAQEVSSIGNPVSTGGSQYPSFSKRKVTTDITVEDGKTIMLAGLIQNKNNNEAVGLPGFKDIPILGGLFGSTKKTNEKTELLITITPYIVTSRAEGERLTGSFQESLQKLRGMLMNNQTAPSLNADALPAKAFELPKAQPTSVAQPSYYAN